MKAYLMFKDKNFVLDDNGMYNSIVTLDDLEIESVLKYASDSDELIHNVLKKSLANPLLDLEEIKYRQEVLKDSLDSPYFLAISIAKALPSGAFLTILKVLV